MSRKTTTTTTATPDDDNKKKAASGKPTDKKQDAKKGDAKKDAKKAKRSYVKAYDIDKLRSICLDPKNSPAFFSLVDEYVETQKVVRPNGEDAEVKKVRPVIYKTVAGVKEVPAPGYILVHSVFNKNAYPPEFRVEAIKFYHREKKRGYKGCAALLDVNCDVLKDWVNNAGKINFTDSDDTGHHYGYTVKQKMDVISFVNEHPDLTPAECHDQLGIPEMTIRNWLSSAYGATVKSYAEKVKNQDIIIGKLRQQVIDLGGTPIA